jgi:CubicO group peptidase (beta-lactamase class C family)
MNTKVLAKRAAKWGGFLILAIALFLVASVGPFFFLAPTPSANPEPVKTVEDLDRYFTSITSEGLPPAMDITVMKGGEKVFSKAYGVADGLTGEAATPDHVYHYWSMTKSVTAVGILQLVEKQRIFLDEPLNTYLSEFVPLDDKGKPVKITVRQLLNHTSGLPDFTTKMLAWVHKKGDPRYGETRMVNERLQGYRTIVSEPGTVSTYGNLNFVLLGAIIEAVTGDTYEDFVRREILQPLKMNATDFIYRPDMEFKTARGSQAYYSFYTLMVEFMGPEGGMDAMTVDEVDGRHWLNLMHTDYAASTSLIGTSGDMSRFGQMLLNLGELDGVRILNEDHARDILYGGRMPGEKEQVMSGERDVALGYGTKTWSLDGTEIIGHGGGGPGYALQYLVVPEHDLVIVALTNSSLAEADELAKLAATVFMSN